MDDADFGRLLAGLLSDAHRCGLDDLPALVTAAARSMGLLEAVIYLADIQQTRLMPLPPPLPDGASPLQEAMDDRPALAMDGTLAGWAYRTESLRLASSGDLVIWLPLVDGIERMGVLRLTAPALDAAALEQCKTLASLIGQFVFSKIDTSDTALRSVRTRPMALQAELAWAFMPPRTIGSHCVTSSAVLEPAYEIGGDAFDHTVTATTLHLSVIDAMGHDLASGLCAAVALAGCRSTRRSGGSLADITEAVDGALNRWLPDRLLTAVFADLDLRTGTLTWVNCGHPSPLLIRHQHVVPESLQRSAQLPLGLNPHGTRTPSVMHHAQLEPGDRILLHTDGVTEARSAGGELFGEDRLVDTIVRATAAGDAAPEALRRLVRTILDHHDGRLTDDATILLAEWHPPATSHPSERDRAHIAKHRAAATSRPPRTGSST
ncbi:PP2C family protein-serine/threonine phosphatase [Streptomyces sp. ISL-94]|uniref:PP2C family protein-serine/threonine phosphatase n=1 Tax=Streptomyces sp. ISL-94 TaxID=2819190 RepID=UPI001BE50D19|nr:PP2C family protein-serine/threonine phosphatase [Streptomyces sp. ISL-94]MBT2482071.1 serine/threonine-protein phosphatase [Streptomyces sp. ISL-94]